MNKRQLRLLLSGVEIDNPLTIYNIDLINVLNEYINHNINQEQLIDWVNVIWFSDLYEYAQSDSDCITEIMHILEELDEHAEPLSIKAANYYINVLKDNKVVPFRTLEIEANK